MWVASWFGLKILGSACLDEWMFGFFLEFGYPGLIPELSVIISDTVDCYPK